MLTYTQQRKDKEARLYLEKKTKALEWIKDCFDRSDHPLTVQQQHTDDLIDLVFDGTVLCRLINLYYPNSINKIFTPKSNQQFYQRIENINQFIKECHHLRVPVIFQPLDLFETKNPARVVNTIYCLIQILDDGLANRRMKRRKEFTIEELARAHIELEVENDSTGIQLSEHLAESLPENIESMPTIQLQVSSSNSYESKTLSIQDSYHTRTTVINTPKLMRTSITPSTYSTPAINNNNHVDSLLSSPLTPNSTEHEEMATTTAIKTAVISTSPISRKSTTPYTYSPSMQAADRGNNYQWSTDTKGWNATTTTTTKRLQPSTFKINDIAMDGDIIYHNNNSGDNNKISLLFISGIVTWMFLFVDNHDTLASPIGV
ncbi:hypothetical protein SAMD00019534_117380 [Acytostelium subglobosum LB1]|uniref:hypothetical protein n=1 Tax=Acytostelium subglobosum LB1 TaxID=1410327 RepID=UPI0006450997|nr:hypothetical protein SAMD00019534_117380 [Acytostelium subglobosum LB1]GAM28562.1 hypothetical protein SAMD00019534_117380 [Acytostelium subglobosum LB1]|eukprot:XP_012748601.1 hypothetical protein SAMD00019534_117380 [Acytostelium subglobosum LB1]